MKKRIISILLVCAVGVSLAACGSKSSKDTSAENGSVETENDAAGDAETDSTSEDQETEEMEESGVSGSATADFGDVGNDPNNIFSYQYYGGMAFDEDYIYYSSGAGIFRVPYDGSEETQIADVGEAEFLNVYDGYLYYVKTSRDSSTASSVSSVMRINRINLSTMEAEPVMEYSGDYWDEPDMNSVLIVDGYLFCGFDDDGSEATIVRVVDLSTMSWYQACSRSADNLYPVLTVSGDDVYVFFNDGDVSSNENSVYKLSLSDAAQQGQFEQVVSTASFGHSSSMIILPDGLYRLKSDTQYYYAAFSDIDEESSTWSYSDDENKIGQNLSALDEETADLIAYPESSYLIEDTLVTINSRYAAESYEEQTGHMYDDIIYDVYCFEDFDLDNPELIGTYQGLYASGVYDNELYFVLYSSVDGVSQRSVMCVSSDGTVTTIR